MRPLACSLHILQGEKATSLRYLLPTLAVIVNALVKDSTNPLTLKAGISRRFEELDNNIDAQLAAVVHPHFKLYWLSDEVQKARLVMTLKS